ncbi:MAG: response regulator [Promethearchaeota archaeon]|nr:MAG: response regulator [Candidatus Lokiarchaeota archaeon]
MYEKMLKISGYKEISIAKNGEEAINMYKSFSEKPDVILMDHRMPIKNGIEATREILELDNTSKIIFTSADQSIKELALSIGAFSFKEKPFTMERLINNIQKALK